MTVCTRDKKCILGSVVGADDHIGPYMDLSPVGKVVDKYLRTIPGVDHFVVMPNHFHAIITIARADMESAPTISEIVQTFKRYSTIEYTKAVKKGILPPFDQQIWQRSFHDHIIRNRDDYNEIFKYISENPMRWYSDRFYAEEKGL